MIRRGVGGGTLDGAERAWFIAGLVSLNPENFNEPHWSVSEDIPLLYDMPSVDQRNLLLYAADLLLESAEEYTPSAVVDAAIYSVLQQSSYFTNPDVSKRQFNEDVELLYYKYLARKAALQMESPKGRRAYEDVPEFESQDRDEWITLVEVLGENILETYDFMMYEKFADVSYETTEGIKSSFGIPSEYFTEVPDFSPSEVKRLLKLYGKWRKEDERNYSEFENFRNAP